MCLNISSVGAFLYRVTGRIGVMFVFDNQRLGNTPELTPAGVPEAMLCRACPSAAGLRGDQAWLPAGLSAAAVHQPVRWSFRV